MFTSERLKHCRTGVYGTFCGSDPVDTCIAADKLKKSENGLKFHRFEGCRRIRTANQSYAHPHLHPRGWIERIEQIGQRPSEEGNEEGMSGLSGQETRRFIDSSDDSRLRYGFIGHSRFESTPLSPIRAHRSFQPTGESSSPGPSLAETLDYAPLFDFEPLSSSGTRRQADGRDGGQSETARQPSISLPGVRRVAAGPARGLRRISLSPSCAFCCPLAYGPEHSHSCGTRRAQRGASKDLRMRRLQKTAQPLQYSMGEGWNGSSTPQDLAGWVHSRDKARDK